MQDHRKVRPSSVRAAMCADRRCCLCRSSELSSNHAVNSPFGVNAAPLLSSLGPSVSGEFVTGVDPIRPVDSAPLPPVADSQAALDVA